MSDRNPMSFQEFLFDIRSVITSPGRRFALIHERSALWGSLVLLIVPVYFAFAGAGRIYFDSDPFPGYSFIIPAIPAAALTLIKVYLIHFFARLLEGRGSYRRGTGTFRGILSLMGYTTVPSILALLLFLCIVLLIPEMIGSLFRNFKVLAISILVAVGVALFVWALILTVLALRVVYPMRDAKIVLAFFLGSVVTAIPAFSTALVMGPAKVDFIYLQPILSRRVVRFFASDPLSHSSQQVKISFHTDRLVYRFKDPKRFELVAFSPSNERSRDRREKGGTLIIGSRSIISLHDEEQIVGRIVGLPGDVVELVQGKLRINGMYWEEPYIAPEYRSAVSLSDLHLGSSQYLILPEDRHLIQSLRNEMVVERQRLTGRYSINKWPLGWFFYQPTAFLKPHPASN